MALMPKTTCYGSTRDMGDAEFYRDYYPFGQDRVASSTDETAYQFTGKEKDSNSGLIYFGARYYDPSIGRFISVDPLAEEYPGWSPYVYALDNPLIVVDPDGKAGISLNFNFHAAAKGAGIHMGISIGYDWNTGQWFIAGNRALTGSNTTFEVSGGPGIEYFSQTVGDNTSLAIRASYARGYGGDFKLSIPGKTLNKKELWELGLNDFSYQLGFLLGGAKNVFVGLESQEVWYTSEGDTGFYIELGNQNGFWSADATNVIEFKEWANSSHTVFQDTNENFHLR
ncbi:hypothetical protein GF354_00615 [Candidatus Peregrinibacteria bacterium]|nr:hypothetical protein [Candidatus Peregrinibacteria bacterium]